jgi:hypothetical protein
MVQPLLQLTLWATPVLAVAAAVVAVAQAVRVAGQQASSVEMVDPV